MELKLELQEAVYTPVVAVNRTLMELKSYKNVP